MDCNKEEAIRAKEIAEKKMQVKDFVGAKKVALKAQQLFSNLDNISQILTVCEVHCCAATKVNGEIDWYGILQVEQTADESSLKKQYRKLALLLHPDKNKFPGAEAAFKLIGEANMILSDRVKRSTYDMKRRGNTTTLLPRQPSSQSNMSSFARKQPGAATNVTSTSTFRYGNINQQQPGHNITFWTKCPFCSTKFQYYRTLLNASIQCQKCLAYYYAHEYVELAVPHPWDSSANLRNHTGFGSGINMTHGNGGYKSKQNEVQPEKVNIGKMDKKHPEQVNIGKMDKKHPEQVNIGKMDKKKHPEKVNIGKMDKEHPEKVNIGKMDKKEHPEKVNIVKMDKEHPEEVNIGKMDKKEHPEEVNIGKMDKKEHPEKVNIGKMDKKEHPEKVNIGKMDKKEHLVKSSAANPRRRRARKVVVESSDSDSDTSTDNDDVDIEDGVHPEEQNAGPSNGRYPRRSCRMKQNVTYKEDRIDEYFPTPRKRARKAPPHAKNTSEEKVPNGGVSVNNGHEAEQAPNVTSISSPDSEFYDFEQERAPSRFAVDQIWAVYADLDAMPRYYVLILQVRDPFKLQFTWLEHKPLNELEKAWTREGLPLACGNYILGNKEFTTDLQMFSHPIDFCRDLSLYEIYPRQGEVWALFKGWDANWTSDANNHRHYEYEVVKVISDVTDSSEFEVVHLLRVQGFVSVFVPSTVNRKTQVLFSEVLRFSHRIPCYKIPNSEFYELDTAALANNFEEAFPCVIADTPAISAHKLNHRTPTSKENFTSTSNDDYLQGEFHDFQKDRSIEKLKCGQIWALFSDIDQYPKFYAKIKKVDSEDVVVSASWVELHATGDAEASWVEKELPATCGRFKVVRGTTTFESIDIFSHIVHANQIGQRASEYDIYPRIGEVWAIYKDWNVGWTLADLGKCEYYVAEILEVGNSVVKVVILTKVADYIAVFKNGDVEKTMEIALNENLRFSHQIPSFRLTNELDGALKGFWELDPASVPGQMYN